MGSLMNLTCLRQKRPRLKLNADKYTKIDTGSSIVMDVGSMKDLEGLAHGFSISFSVECLDCLAAIEHVMRGRLVIASD